MAAEKAPPPKRHLAFNIVYFIFVLFSVLLIRDLLVVSHEQTILYGEYQQLLAKRALNEVAGPTRITGSCVKPGPNGEPMSGQGGLPFAKATLSKDDIVAMGERKAKETGLAAAAA